MTCIDSNYHYNHSELIDAYQAEAIEHIIIFIDGGKRDNVLPKLRYYLKAYYCTY